jgi:hypothetical protein
MDNQNGSPKKVLEKYKFWGQPYAVRQAELYPQSSTAELVELYKNLAVTVKRMNELEVENERLREKMRWQPIESAPKGYPALGDPSEWFIGWSKNNGPVWSHWAIIRRTFYNGFGPWQGTGDEQYKADYFTHWMPLPKRPKAEELVGKEAS